MVFSFFSGGRSKPSTKRGVQMRCDAVNYGPNKRKGGHDHRYNKGPDRTPRQREADKRRKGTSSFFNF